jgi:hypothetical protein
LIIAKTLLAASAFAVAAAPIVADAAPRHRYLVCNTSSAVRRNANNGTVIGAVGGQRHRPQHHRHPDRRRRGRSGRSPDRQEPRPEEAVPLRLPLSGARPAFSAPRPA